MEDQKEYVSIVFELGYNFDIVNMCINATCQYALNSGIAKSLGEVGITPEDVDEAINSTLRDNLLEISKEITNLVYGYILRKLFWVIEDTDARICDGKMFCCLYRLNFGLFPADYSRFGVVGYGSEKYPEIENCVERMFDKEKFRLFCDKYTNLLLNIPGMAKNENRSGE